MSASERDSHRFEPHTIAVLGLGYIGLPTATVLADEGFRVIGFDISERAVRAVNDGDLHFYEPALAAALSAARESGRLTASSYVPVADVYIVAVPTPVSDDHSPDVSAVHAAVDAIAAVIQPGQLVVIESTVPPGTTQTCLDRILAARPDLASPSPSAAQDPILCAHVPERVLPGRIMSEIRTNDRIVGGLTPEGAEAAATIYRSFCEGDVLLTDAVTAEICKLAENSYRDVNIAFANELSMICDALGANVWELIALANRHPRVNILQPGAGVGGHCIAVDPWFIVDAAPDSSRLIATARSVNDVKPKIVVAQALSFLAARGTDSVTVFGLSFKPDVDDVRESPAVEIAMSLAHSDDVHEVLVVDPHVKSLPEPLVHNPTVRLVDLATAVAADGVVVIAVAHSEFRDLDGDDLRRRGLVDPCGVISTRETLETSRIAAGNDER